MKIFKQPLYVAENGEARVAKPDGAESTAKAPLDMGGLFWKSMLALGGFGVASFGLTFLLVALGSLAFGWDFGAIMGPATLAFFLCIHLAIHGFSGIIALDEAAHPARLWTIGVLLLLGALLLGSTLLAGLGVWTPTHFVGYLVFSLALSIFMAIASMKLSLD